MGFGLLVGRRRGVPALAPEDIKRLFAYSSVEHMGIMTFAFGMGGPIASFAGLLHMTVHSLDQIGHLLHRRPCARRRPARR